MQKKQEKPSSQIPKKLIIRVTPDIKGICILGNKRIEFPGAYEIPNGKSIPIAFPEKIPVYHSKSEPYYGFVEFERNSKLERRSNFELIIKKDPNSNDVINLFVKYRKVPGKISAIISEDLQQVMEGWKKAIEGFYLDVEIETEYIKQQQVLLKFENGTYDICLFHKTTSNAFQQIVGFRPIVIIVHKSNPIKNLALNDLSAIYQGNIRNWSVLTDRKKTTKIITYSKQIHSEGYNLFSEEILKKYSGMASMFGDVKERESDQEILEAVQNNTNAIGYLNFRPLATRINFKILSLNNLQITTNQYPLKTEICMQNKNEGIAQKIVDFALSLEGQKILKETGYIPKN